MERAFERVAIVNRGEPAVRLIRAARELGRERGQRLRTIALYTEPDRKALFVREADEAFALGSALFVDPKDGRRKSRYLDYDALERALRESRAEAAWVGWGFVAEHEEFAELCRRLGVVFVGPDPEVMRSLGDKIGSKRMAEEAGVPVAPWSGGAVESLEEARAHAEKLGYPLMVKATAGGGGRGIRRVRSGADLAEAFESARSEALAGFGDATVFMERLLEGARHIEVQIIGDGQTCWALGVRDCTVQRRNQKVIEESPSPALSPEQHREICDAAARLGQRAGYRNAGTVEFLYDPRTQRFSFMEVNARLQVEHPVTECTTGADLVKLQLHVAGGGLLEGDPPPARGHAIEVRVNAEDPERGFAPTPGVVELLRLPGGPGVRIDSGFVEGDRIAPEFDSMLAKLIAFGGDREQALARLERALHEMRLAIRGGASNKGFLLGLLARPEVRSGEVDVGWLDGLAARGEHLVRTGAEVALLQGAIEAYEEDLAHERAQFFATAARGRLRLRREVGHEVELRYAGTSYHVRLFGIGPSEYRVAVDGVSAVARVERLSALERRLEVGGERFHVVVLASGTDLSVEVDGVPHRLSRDDAGMVRSPAPAVVVSFAVDVGDEVSTGDRVAVLEAMKTELAIAAPCSGRVRQILVKPNVQVDAGAPLVVIEPLEGEREELPPPSRLRFDRFADGQEAGATSVGARCHRNLEDLHRLVLGFDVDEGEARRAIAERKALCAELPDDDEEILRREDEILTVFADVCALFEHREEESELAVRERRTAEEYLLLYLRSLDPAAAGLSPAFVERLQRALGHYGIGDLERTPELEESLLWICKAHQRMDVQVAVVLSILERRLDAVESLRGGLDGSFRSLLDRVVTVTRGRFQGLSDLARELRYRLYDRPFFEEVRARSYAEMHEHLEALRRGSAGEERERHVQELVDCSQPLTPSLIPRFGSSEPAFRSEMLEVMTRRYYRIRDLRNLRTVEIGGRGFFRADYEFEGREIHVFTTFAPWEELEEAARVLRSTLAAVPESEDVVVDFYLHRSERHTEEDETERALRALLEGVDFGRRLRRIVVAVAAASGGRGIGAMQHFTFRPAEAGGLREDRLYRNMHPMMGKRLQTWRLSNFEIERLPSTQDVYLFRGVARSNPKDQRLFAFAEVRDLTPQRDASGRLERLPHLEMMLLEALASIRVFQSRRGPRDRLHWNRVLLFVWPPLRFSVEELNEVANRLTPAAADLGLQKTVVRARVPDEGGALRDTVIQIGTPGGREVVLRFTPPADRPIATLSEYDQKVVRMRQRGLLYPYEIIRMLTPEGDATRTGFPRGDFVEYDLDDGGALVPVEREHGRNVANVVVGLIRSFTPKHPEGMARVLILGDPSREMGSVSEPECRRINAALDLAERERLPVDWFAISAGAKISMETGTETMDWCAAVVRRIVEFTQGGGEVNVVVAGINVGAQSYWNAEATMLMHTRGMLIMTLDGAMVLTGKRSLDYSGGVSAEDNAGIGGYERIMGPNGQAQYWARDIAEACHLLLRYYEHAYVAPGERFPRRATTNDPLTRDVTTYPHGRHEGYSFDVVGEIFSDEHNPGRRKPFDIRAVMRAVIDQDHAPMERWPELREGESAVVWDAHVGGIPVCMVGIESRNIQRLGFVPADGPDQWTAGTLFPLSSKKVARAVNSASGNRPLALLVNLSGFDGSPESMRRLQLEYGAEIARAVVNFRGPIVLCVVSRYHGGAYVVFSAVLNENILMAALEGTYASVIGGAPAAAVVFAREVEARARSDARLQALEKEIAEAEDSERGRLRARWHSLYEQIHSEKLGEVAEEFDGVHSVERARRVGSLHSILPPESLRPFLIDALERGMRREMERWRAADGDA